MIDEDWELSYEYFVIFIYLKWDCIINHGLPQRHASKYNWVYTTLLFYYVNSQIDKLSI
jgi:hypothetical protein